MTTTPGEVHIPLDDYLDLKRKADALVHFLETSWEALTDNAERFTCTEIESIASAVAACRRTHPEIEDDRTVGEFIARHAVADEPTDHHFGRQFRPVTRETP